jgi:hypothetical protein
MQDERVKLALALVELAVEQALVLVEVGRVEQALALVEVGRVELVERRVIQIVQVVCKVLDREV